LRAFPCGHHRLRGSWRKYSVNLGSFCGEQNIRAGGFGKVYFGIHKVTKQKVAIKIINSGYFFLI